MAGKKFGGSSLSEQLRAISEQDRLARGVLAGSKQRPSFLFDQGEAADYDNEAIYNLAVDAFDTLSKTDPALRAFRETFYGARTVAQDISLYTRKEKDAIDAQVGPFLMAMSPHFLSPDAHKALEWMVRRWRINECNVDDLIVSILPYHETQPFVRMVQIVYFTEGSRWSFLFERVRKSAQTISRTLLAQRSVVDPSILERVMDALAIVRDWKPLDGAEGEGEADQGRRSIFISFATCLSLEVLGASPRPLSDETTIRTFQRLQVFTRNRRCAEATIGGMMVFTQLCQQAALSSEACTSFLRQLARRASPATSRHVLLTAVRAVEGGHVEALEGSLGGALIAMPNFAPLMEEICSSFKLAAFPSLLAASIRGEAGAEGVELLMARLCKKGLGPQACDGPSR